MSVLIKGLKMPKKGTCIEIAIFDDGTVEYYDDEKKIGEGKAVELPPHGDLIDRDEAADDVCLIWCRNSSGDDAAQEIIEHLRKMKAVIPAERSEDATD